MLAHVIPFLKTLQWIPITHDVKPQSSNGWWGLDSLNLILFSLHLLPTPPCSPQSQHWPHCSASKLPPWDLWTCRFLFLEPSYCFSRGSLLQRILGLCSKLPYQWSCPWVPYNMSFPLQGFIFPTQSLSLIDICLYIYLFLLLQFFPQECKFQANRQLPVLFTATFLYWNNVWNAENIQYWLTKWMTIRS